MNVYDWKGNNLKLKGLTITMVINHLLASSSWQKVTLLKQSKFLLSMLVFWGVNKRRWLQQKLITWWYSWHVHPIFLKNFNMPSLTLPVSPPEKWCLSKNCLDLTTFFQGYSKFPVNFQEKLMWYNVHSTSHCLTYFKVVVDVFM